MTGQPAGTPGDEPMKVGLAISDLMTGMYATTAILAALEHRNISGKGQFIDMSLLDCMVAINSYQAVNYFLSGQVPTRMGNAHSNMVPYQVFKCRKGDVIVAVGNDTQFRAFCRVIGLEPLGTDPLFATAGQRNRNRAALIRQLAAALSMQTMEEWVVQLEAANVPCGPIYTMQQVFENPQVRHREMKVSLPHANGVNAPGVANPIRFSETPIKYEHSAPALGEHTHRVLTEKLGLSKAQLAALEDKGVI